MTVTLRHMKTQKAELLAIARQMTAREITEVLRYRLAMHAWAVEAYEEALTERKRSK